MLSNARHRCEYHLFGFRNIAMLLPGHDAEMFLKYPRIEEGVTQLA